MALKTIDPRVADLRYRPDNFADLYEKIGAPIWDFIRREDNMIRMETATFLERAAIEPLAPGLLDQFDTPINEDRTRQMLGHMVRQAMESIGYVLDRSGLRFTRENMFTGGTSYRPNDTQRDRSMKVTREQREAWAQKTAKSPFNEWLNSQVRNADGTLNLDKMYQVAKKYGVNEEYRHLNPGQQRMNIGARLRNKVDPKNYGEK